MTFKLILCLAISSFAVSEQACYEWIDYALAQKQKGTPNMDIINAMSLHDFHSLCHELYKEYEFILACNPEYDYDYRTPTLHTVDCYLEHFTGNQQLFQKYIAIPSQNALKEWCELNPNHFACNP